jgi:prepilin signal peptidase PulO-like enzyme (type II secretory pathway)
MFLAEIDMQLIVPLLTAYLVFVGLALGSFINLAADRLPRRESLIRPRSHCRNCGRQLNTVDLLPVVGYVLRQGRCATCRRPIGASAPLVEVIAGACMAGPVVVFGLWPGAAVGIVLLAGWGLAVTGLAAKRHASEAAG